MKLPEHLKTFITGSLITIGGNLILGLSNYLVRRIMVFQLPEFEYGCFYGTFSLVMILTAIADLGLVNAGTVLISEKQERASSFFSAVLYLKILTAGGVGTLFFLFRGRVAEYYLDGAGSRMLAFFGALILISAVNDAFTAYFYGHKYYHISSMFRCVTAFVLLGTIALLTRDGSGAGAAAAYVASYLFAVIIQFCWVHQRSKVGAPLGISRDIYKQLIKLTGPLSVIACIQIIWANLDSVMLTYLCGPEAVAVYNVALPVTQLLLSVLIFAAVFLPVATDLAKSGKYEQLQKFANGALIITIICLPLLFLGCKLYGKLLIVFLFKGSYADSAAMVLPWLMCGYLLFASGAFIVQILIAMRKIKVLLAIVISTLFCNIILNYCLIMKLAEFGASLATFFSYLFFAVATFLLFIGIMKKMNHKM